MNSYPQEFNAHWVRGGPAMSKPLRDRFQYILSENGTPTSVLNFLEKVVTSSECLKLDVNAL